MTKKLYLFKKGHNPIQIQVLVFNKKLVSKYKSKPSSAKL
jgi:hypothetical protein